MWYSATKVGITDIDLEHGNIDAMLDMIITGKAETQLVGKVLDTLSAHYQNEETLIHAMGIEFPAAHREEHASLKELLIAKKQQWSEGKISSVALAHELKQLLIYHVNEFDRHLANL